MYNFSKPKIEEIFNEILSVRDATFPEYTTKDKADFGVMLMWIFSVIVKFFADFINRKSKNMYLNSAIDRDMIVSNAIDKGYRPRGVLSNKQLIVFTSTASVTIPKGFQVVSNAGLIYETDANVSIGTGGGTAEVYATQGESRTDVFVSDGMATQSFRLSDSPFVDDSVSVNVQDEGEYFFTNNILLAGIDEKVFYSQSDESGNGTIYFGNGSNGKIPALGKSIKVNFKVGVGKAGNVEDGSITDSKTTIAGVTEITNVKVLNTVVSAPYSVGDSILTVKSTYGFINAGQAFIDGYLFNYTSKNDFSFIGVSNINFPIPENATVSVSIYGLVNGKNLESNDEIRLGGMLMARANDRIVTDEDYKSFIEKHPAVSWAKAYRVGNMIHIISIGVDGNALGTILINDLTNSINKINIPTVSYIFATPSFVPIDVLIHAESDIVFDSNEIISSNPLIYKGIKQNINLAVSEYLSPVNYGTLVTKGVDRTLTVFQLYDILSKIEGLNNASILVFSKAIPDIGTVSILANSSTISLSSGVFVGLEPGDYIRLIGSISGSDGIYKISSIASGSAIIVANVFTATESGIKYTKASIGDITLGNNDIPTVGSISIIDNSIPIGERNVKSFLKLRTID